jgi:FkbM family methyltransferase
MVMMAIVFFLRRSSSIKTNLLSEIMMMNLIDLIKNIIKDRIVSLHVLKRLAIRYCIHNELFPSLFVHTPSSILREMLELPSTKYQTQLNQDIFALLMNRFRPGFFLEIGANDGFTFSNTVYLEYEFGWKGILVEANQKYMRSLAKRKNSIVVNKAVSTQNGQADFIDAGLYGGLKASMADNHQDHTKDAECIKVECMRLQEILDKAEAPDRIDFVSVDVEGGELPIVEQMVSVNRRFRCGCIEYNDRKYDYATMVLLLKKAGYRIVWENKTGYDLFFHDNN